VKFIVDAQLPKALSDFLRVKGFDSVHTLELPDKNKTQDNIINTIADKENRIVITKDNDFLESFLLEGKPAKLVLIKTGNIRNTELINLFENQMHKISLLLEDSPLIVIYKNEIVAHS
jgi:predicted nuclease of predicted toxin-antitoxin system